jgi:hypothetical protein
MVKAFTFISFLGIQLKKATNERHGGNMITITIDPRSEQLLKKVSDNWFRLFWMSPDKFNQSLTIEITRAIRQVGNPYKPKNLRFGLRPARYEDDYYENLG